MDGKIIQYMFLFRVTPTMQSMLEEDDTSSIADLTARADALMDTEAAKDHPIAAAVEEVTVAAAGVAPFLRMQEEAGVEQKEEARGQEATGRQRQAGPWPLAGPRPVLVP